MQATIYCVLGSLPYFSPYYQASAFVYRTIVSDFLLNFEISWKYEQRKLYVHICLCSLGIFEIKDLPIAYSFYSQSYFISTRVIVKSSFLSIGKDF
jgi:hypothetical protein